MLIACGKADDLDKNTSLALAEEPTAIPTEAPTATPEPTPRPTPIPTPTPEPDYEGVDADMFAYRDYFGTPIVSMYLAIRNTNDYPITFKDLRMDYEDKNGRLLSTDKFVYCIPRAIKPGQIGYIYSYHHDISGVDLSNGFEPHPSGYAVEATNYYEVEVSDVSASAGNYLDVTVIGRGTNNTGKNLYNAEPSAVFFDKNNKPIGFCYGLESFDKGQRKTFEIAGDLISDEFDASDVDHVEVYIQDDLSY